MRRTLLATKQKLNMAAQQGELADAHLYMINSSKCCCDTVPRDTRVIIALHKSDRSSHRLYTHPHGSYDVIGSISV